MKPESPIPDIRKVDSVGRISVPPKLLDALGIHDDTTVLLHVDKRDDSIILKKDKGSCVFCGNPQTIVVNDANISICADCRNQNNLRKLVEERYEKQTIPTHRRLVIPFKIRHDLNIKTADKISVIHEGNALRMRKVEKTEE